MDTGAEVTAISEAGYRTLQAVKLGKPPRSLSLRSWESSETYRENFTSWLTIPNLYLSLFVELPSPEWRSFLWICFHTILADQMAKEFHLWLVEAMASKGCYKSCDLSEPTVGF